MGRPVQGNKAQTPVGYSHGTGVSMAARLRQYWEWLLGIHRGCKELSGGYGVTAPSGSVTRGCGDSLQAPGEATKRRCVRRRI